MLDLVTRSREDCVLIESDRLKLARQQIEFRGRQCGQKAVTSSTGIRHCGWSAIFVITGGAQWAQTLFKSASFRTEI